MREIEYRSLILQEKSALQNESIADSSLQGVNVMDVSGEEDIRSLSNGHNFAHGNHFVGAGITKKGFQHERNRSANVNSVIQ